MKPKDAFGRYGCVPRDLHPAWLAVSWSARSIGMALFSLIDDFETRRVEVHGDWMDSVCKRLGISGKERRFVKPALRSLEEVRLLTVHRTFIVVNTTPAVSIETYKSTQVSENNQFTEVQQVKQQSEVNARASEPLLHEKISKLYSDRYVQLYAAGAPSDDTAARKLAAWCEKTAKLRGCSPPELAEQVIAGLFETKDRKTIERRHPLRFAAHDAGQFVRALKPIRAVEDVGARLAREDEERLQLVLAERAQLAAGAT